MKTNDTTILNNQNENEETLLNGQYNEETQPIIGSEKGKVSRRNNKINWKEVSISGISGILLGGASVLFTGSASAKNDEDAPGNNKTNDNSHGEDTPLSPGSHITVNGLPIADNVNDDMSFSEAFAAAREDVGPGGVFEWHGGVYGTFYADEWNSMTPEQQAEFSNRISYGAGGGAHTQQQADVKQKPADLEHETEVHQDEPLDNDGVTILGIDETEIDGQQATIAGLQVEGQEVVIMDIDHDGVFDLEAVDLNDNGMIENNEVVDIQDQNITVECVQQDLQAQDAQINNYIADSDAPDYMNEANPEGFMA